MGGVFFGGGDLLFFFFFFSSPQGFMILLTDMTLNMKCGRRKAACLFINTCIL